MSEKLPSFLDELEKISNAGRGLIALYLGKEKVKKGIRRHKETMRAVEEGYPAGWVSLGMRPR